MNIEIRKQMRRVVSLSNSIKVDNICAVLDPNRIYKFEYIENATAMERLLYEYKNNKIKYIYFDIVTLYGNLILTPRVRFSRDFLCIVTSSYIRSGSSVTEEHKVIVLEDNSGRVR